MHFICQRNICFTHVPTTQTLPSDFFSFHFRKIFTHFNKIKTDAVGIMHARVIKALKSATDKKNFFKLLMNLFLNAIKQNDELLFRLAKINK